MEIKITTFTNPFSFFGKIDAGCKSVNNFPKTELLGNTFTSRKDLTDANHGQYVAVLWNNEWVRGVITMETQFRIWLVDCGTYIRPDDKTVFITLPSEYKNYPTKVFEASIHGVIPIDKILNEECQIENQISTSWNKGALEKAQKLISTALKTYFVPVALLSTKHNDVVLGDLYLDMNGKDVLNIIEALEMWPVFLQKNKQAYIENLSNFYTSRRRHYVCHLKPVFPDITLPSLSLDTTFKDYSAICEKVPAFVTEQDTYSNSQDGATAGNYKDLNESFKLTPEEINKYSQMTVTISGREYKVLNILLNKARDLRMCEKYKDFNVPSVGRAYSRKSFQHI